MLYINTYLHGTFKYNIIYLYIKHLYIKCYICKAYIYKTYAYIYNITCLYIKHTDTQEMIYMSLLLIITKMMTMTMKIMIMEYSQPQKSFKAHSRIQAGYLHSNYQLLIKSISRRQRFILPPCTCFKTQFPSSAEDQKNTKFRDGKQIKSLTSLSLLPSPSQTHTHNYCVTLVQLHHFFGLWILLLPTKI